MDSKAKLINKESAFTAVPDGQSKLLDPLIRNASIFTQENTSTSDPLPNVLSVSNLCQVQNGPDDFKSMMSFRAQS